MNKKILFTLLIGITALSCVDSNDKKEVSTWIGGEIINPKYDYVVISKNQEVLDSVPLDRNNFFKYEIKDCRPGLYTFSHFEYQRFYLEPQDSIMIRVNTLEFDESLSFTGKGAAKNNYMMEMFLLNESESKIVDKWYQLEPFIYEMKLDSMKKVRMGIYDRFVQKNKVSPEFKNLAKSSMEYDFATKKEWYITTNNMAKEREPIEIPANFYDFRRNINYGEETLGSYYPYYRFLSYHLDNLAYQEYQNEAPFNRYSFQHNINKTKLIDSLIEIKPLKERLLVNNVRRFLLNSKSAEEDMEVLNLYLSISENEEYKEELKKLAETTINLLPEHQIPNMMLLTTDNTVKDLHSVFKKPTVIYFWSAQSIQHYKNIHLRANELRSKYPEYDFIGINTDTHFKKWLKIVENSGYDSQKEFQFENISNAEKKLLISSVNKAIVVDEKGMIVEGNTNLFSPYIEEQLLGFINK